MIVRPMKTVVICPACNIRLRLPDHFGGQKVKCPKCDGIISIAGSATPTEAVSARSHSLSPMNRNGDRPLTASNVAEDDDAPKAKSNARLRSPTETARRLKDQETDSPTEVTRREAADEEASAREGKSKKKKKKRTRNVESKSAKMWWAIGLGAAVFLIGAGFLAATLAGYKEQMIAYAVQLAIMIPLSVIVLVISMVLTSVCGGGVEFGEAHIAILKAGVLLLAVNLVSLLPLGGVLAVPVWVFGLMRLYGLDLWETRFLVFINWFLNYILNWILLAVVLAMIMHGKLDPQHFEKFNSRPASATQQENDLEALEKLGGEIEYDENGEELRIIGVNLSRSRATDADLVYLRSTPSVHKLDLSNTRVTDKGLKSVKGLKRLSEVKLTGTQVTNVGVEDLQKALPDVKIQR